MEERPKQRVDLEQKAAAGRASAEARRLKTEAKILAQEQLDNPVLDSPEQVRDYLKLVLAACVRGDIPATSATAASHVAAKLLQAMSLSITEELEELRRMRETWEEAQSPV